MSQTSAQQRKKTAEPRRMIPGLPTGRIKEGRRLRSFRLALIAHCGGSPSIVQQTLIDRAVMLSCHLSRFDLRAADYQAEPSDHSGRQYLAWSNSLSRILRTLGLDAQRPADPEQDPYWLATSSKKYFWEAAHFRDDDE
jgi:hypothetical protein